MSLVRAAAIVALALVAEGAPAQPVYRCGNVYSSTPCPDGKRVDADDPRTAEQQAEAARLARGQKRLGNAMARDRRAEEAAQRPRPAATVGPVRPASSAASASLKPKKKAKAKIRVIDDDDVIDPVPRPRRKTTP